MEDDMAWENTSTGFAKRAHTELLHRFRGNTTTDSHALLQTRHKEHLRIARACNNARLQELLQDFFQSLSHHFFRGLLHTSLQRWSHRLSHGFLGAAALQPCLVDAQLPADPSPKPILQRPWTLLRKASGKGRDARQHARGLALPEGSLEKALKALGDIRDDASHNHPVSFRIVILGDSRPLEPVVHEQVYWIAREALLNACRHSAATRVEAEIEYWERKLRVVVRDNGAGFDPDTLQTGQNHRGLTSMHDRAASIGAKIRVASRPGGGTEVEISLPL